ncbi:hypothetical protein Pmani_023398 [Petrolisthes manimaculis]|uniref:Nucleolar protein 9 n=1 Tax=Petrolisthes manimaculis TaxID=1843537 RepID=A0AAE1PB56_9EUCA|nr:hypothetical protein Pmani_023398 [Petrolisthes manimaculis]
MDHVNTQKPRKKKKKNNFLRQAKQQGKKGNYGRGKKLSEEEYNYYMRVLEQLKHVDGEEKEILVRNFFREVQREGQEKSLASNQIVSRILDDALPFADISQVLALTRVFTADLRVMSVDPFSSHVVQTLLTLALKYSQKDAGLKRYEDSNEGEEVKEVTVKITQEQKDEFCTFLEKVGKFAFNNLQDFVLDTYASHIVRSVLEVCSGVDVPSDLKSSHKSHLSHGLCKDDGKLLSVPPNLKQLLKDLAQRFQKLSDLPDIMSNDCGSAVLQSLVSVLGIVEEKECEDVVTHLLQHGLPGVVAWYSDSQQEQSYSEDASAPLPPLFLDPPTTRLLEVMMRWCSNEQQSTIFHQYFQNNMKVLVQHRHTNFAVQRLLDAWKDKETFSDVYDEVSVCLSVAVEAGHLGVVQALASACRRLSTQQAQCMKVLMQLVNCWEPEKQQVQFAMLMLRLNSQQQEQSSSAQVPVSLHGSCVLQSLLHFQKPIKVVTSLLESSVGDLQDMACDPRGCHVVDAFTSSTAVGAKSKEKFVYSFKETYTSLACSKHGSRSLEELWKVASIKAKTQICRELVTDEYKLKDSPFGKIIYNKFKVDMFKRGNKGDWQELVDKAEKKRTMFEDLLKEDEVSEKHKKKKAKTENNPENFTFISAEGDDV